jgi:hypothetical protein
MKIHEADYPNWVKNMHIVDYTNDDHDSCGNHWSDMIVKDHDGTYWAVPLLDGKPSIGCKSRTIDVLQVQPREVKKIEWEYIADD